MWKYGQHKPYEAIEILAVSCRGNEPREFENNELKELVVLIFVNYNR